MLFKVFTSAVLASLAFQPAGAVPAPQENSVINLAAVVKADHPEAYAAFLKAPKITLDGAVRKRQAVPGDGNPDPDRPPVTPDNIFLLQCSDAGFLGECLSFGAPPGRCGKKSDPDLRQRPSMFSERQHGTDCQSRQ